MGRKLLFLFVCGCLGGQMFTPRASAQGPSSGFSGYWYGPPYTFYQQEQLPYFSLHPPVYYSVPVPRTYGYSPFAYPPGLMTPDVQLGAPVEIQNPHVPKKANLRLAPKPSADQSTRRQPKLIINPFVGVQTARVQ